MGNIDIATNFSRLKRISAIEDNYFYFSNLFVCKCLFIITKEDYHPLFYGEENDHWNWI